MSWGYVIAGAAVVLGAAYYLSEKEARAKARYERKEREYTRTIKAANRKIARSQHSAQARLRKSELKSMHLEAKLAADKVYAGIKDAKVVVAGYHRIIKQTMQEKSVLKAKMKESLGEVRREIKARLRALNAHLTQVYAEKDQQKASIDSLYAQLSQLNKKTAQIKQKMLAC